MGPHVRYTFKGLNHVFGLGATYYPKARVGCKRRLDSVFCAAMLPNNGVLCNFLILSGYIRVWPREGFILELSSAFSPRVYLRERERGT